MFFDDFVGDEEEFYGLVEDIIFINLKEIVV